MKHEQRPAIYMEKPLGWACKLGGAESLGISKVGQTVVARLMALSGEDLERGQWSLLTLMPDTSGSPSVPLVPFKMLCWSWSLEVVSLSR